MSTYDQLRDMLEIVANALGVELLQSVVFVGGCTTGLFITDEFTKETVRYTDDVDLIVDIMGHAEWYKLRDTLINKGFHEAMETVNCRMLLGELKVDFMPGVADVLGFTNKWYQDALDNAVIYKLKPELKIRILTPPLFIATKLEAYLGRGENDPLASHDIEDILTLLDGRPEIVFEIQNTEDNLRLYISDQFKKLLKHPDFDYAVQGATKGDSGRTELIFERIHSLVESSSTA